MAAQHGSCEKNHHTVSHLRKQKGFQSESKRHRSYFLFIDQQILQQIITSQLATLPKFSPKYRFKLTPSHFIGVASKRCFLQAISDLLSRPPSKRELAMQNKAFGKLVFFMWLESGIPEVY